MYICMAAERGNNNISTGKDGFVWENESWALSNSDNSGSDENVVCKKKMKITTNCPTPPTGKRKRSRNSKQPNGGDDHQKGNIINDGELAGGKGGELDHELHIWTERERRKKMRTMFSNLQALLPQLPPKADKSSIVDEAVKYIRTLQQTLQRLQKQKLEMLQGLTTSYDPHSHRSVVAMDSREAFLADHHQGYCSSSTTTHELTTTTSNINIALGVSPYSTVFRTWAAPNLVLSVCGDKAHINICCPKKVGLFSAICYFLEKHKLQVLSAHISSDLYRTMYMIQAHATGTVDQLSEAALSIDDIFQLATGEIMMYMSSL